jgi:hypothetical protein
MTDLSRPSEPVPVEEPPAEPVGQVGLHPKLAVQVDRSLAWTGEPVPAPVRWLCSRTGMRHVSG